MSNNSVICSDTSQLPADFWEGYNGNGEPYGLINLEASRRMGRTFENEYPDPDVQGFNPCAEQSLANFETCCLAEIYLPNIENYEELLRVSRLLYRINKHSLAIPCAIEETEDIVHKNMRMGIGVTGYLQATEEQRSWLSNCYEQLRIYDDEYSRLAGFPSSIKLTTVKPSGTLSLLAGVTPGAHPGYSQYYIRRIRMASDSDLVRAARRNGYPVEYVRNFDGTEDKSTSVVSFPCQFPVGTKFANDMTAIDQLEVIKRLQAEWSDNAVSVTIYYRKEELDAIKDWLRLNYKNVKSVSFLLHNDHGFDQAPLEEITEEEFTELWEKVTPITSLEQLNMDDIDIQDCEGGACPVR
jgi:ribonucleotide reductase alpha subunit